MAVKFNLKFSGETGDCQCGHMGRCATSLISHLIFLSGLEYGGF